MIHGLLYDASLILPGASARGGAGRPPRAALRRAGRGAARQGAGPGPGARRQAYAEPHTAPLLARPCNLHRDDNIISSGLARHRSGPGARWRRRTAWQCRGWRCCCQRPHQGRRRRWGYAS
jgi:hypothetical protein